MICLHSSSYIIIIFVFHFFHSVSVKCICLKLLICKWIKFIHFFYSFRSFSCFPFLQLHSFTFSLLFVSRNKNCMKFNLLYNSWTIWIIVCTQTCKCKHAQTRTYTCIHRKNQVSVIWWKKKTKTEIYNKICGKMKKIYHFLLLPENSSLPLIISN